MSLDTDDPHLAALTVHGDVGTFPPHAELVRTLLDASRTATLTTLTAAGAVEPGYPYGSLVACSVLADGSPLLCISELAEHTRNAHADDRAGLVVQGLAVEDGADPLDRPRAGLVGRLVAHRPSTAELADHLARHPGVAAYCDFPDFAWWRLSITAARYVGGFGHMSWVTGDEIAAAEPDPVLAAAQPAIDHLNADHRDALVDMVQWIAGLRAATDARVHSLDRRGLTLYADVPGAGALATARVAFADGPLASADLVRPAVVALARRARSIAEAR